MATQVSLNSGAIASAGALAIQTNGTTEAVSISTGQVATLAQNPVLTSGTANGVAYLNGSKVLTTGSALVFDGTNFTAPRTQVTTAGTPPASGAGIEIVGSTSPVILAYNRGTSAYLPMIQYGSSFTWGISGGTTDLVLTSTGLGIGASSPAQKLAVNGGLNVLGSATLSAAQGSMLFSYESAVNRCYMGDGTGYSFAFSKRVSSTTTDLMTLTDGGNLIVAGTAAGLINNNSQQITANGYLISNHVNGTSSGSVYVYFGYNGSSIGSITQNGTTGVLYNLTSDYRLKNDQQALTGAKDFIMALKPKKWQWWDGSGEGVGFVAHEFMEVAKHSGNGEKDAVDADGKPVYQSIQPSSSEVMANLVAFLQELKAEFDAYKASHP
jgi:hypothetical protein